MPDTNGWETYSKLVLQQLETLSHGIEGLRTELQDMKNQLTELKANSDRDWETCFSYFLIILFLSNSVLATFKSL